MINHMEKIQDKNLNKNIESSYIHGSFLNAKNKKVDLWRELKDSYKGTLLRTLHIMQKIDGISLWKINYQLNRLAVRGIEKEDLKKGKIVLSLPSKKTGETISNDQKSFIEKKVDELDGFENLRLRQFYHYKPIYLENKVYGVVSRWIEIEISEL